jgi:hypothetical protein
MKRLLIILFLFIPLICSATKYYVKNTGSDANTGLSDVQAWQTIDKVNISSFSAGDTIAFKCGDTWRESLVVPSSGTAGSYIVITSYGTGAKPKIYGSELEDTWTLGDIPEVAANNDLLDESFEGTGYENSWAETIGSNESNLVDEDNTDVARPTGGGSQILKIVKDVTPTATAAASAAKTVYDFGSVQSDTYVDFYIMINAHGLASSGNQMRLFVMYDGSLIAGGLNLYNASGSIRFEVNSRINGEYIYAYYPESGSITLNQWYHFQYKYDVNEGKYSATIDDYNTVIAGDITGTSPTGVRYVEFGSAINTYTLTAYYDLLNISSTNFYSPLVDLPANVWYSDGIYNNPYGLSYHSRLFYKETDGSISWGNKQEIVLNDLDSLYEFSWASRRVVIYSISNPNSYFSGVEIPQRLNCIDLDEHEYIKVDNIETGFSSRCGVTIYYPQTDLSGLTVSNCYMHHHGTKEYGHSIFSAYSDVLIENNLIHDCGRRGLSINNDGAVTPYTLERVIIQDNTFYNGFHTTGVDIINHASCSMDSIIVRRNYIYDDPLDIIDGKEIFKSEGMFIANQGGVSVTKVYIYDNIIKDTKQDAISLEDVDECYVYNNTFHGVNLSLTGTHALLSMSTNANAVIENNIFYNNSNSATTTTFACLYFSATAGTATSDYNLFYNTDASSRFLHWDGTTYTTAQWATYKTASSQDAHSPTPADPLFYSSSDYRLQLGSPAYHTGVNLGLGTDYVGRLWNDPPSLGALEYPSTNLILLRDSNGKLLRTSGGKLIRQ